MFDIYQLCKIILRVKYKVINQHFVSKVFKQKKHYSKIFQGG